MWMMDTGSLHARRVRFLRRQLEAALQWPQSRNQGASAATFPPCVRAGASRRRLCWTGSRVKPINKIQWNNISWPRGAHGGIKWGHPPVV